MRTASHFVAAFAGFALVAGAAFAKAPKPAEETSVEDVWQQAQKDLVALKEKEKQASRDVLREQINNYREKVANLDDWQPLADCLNDEKTEKVQSYRRDAADALRVRFSREDPNSPLVKATQKKIALAILPLMKADAKKDEVGLKAVEMLLLAWWPQRVQFDLKFSWKDKLDDRKKAFTKMQKYLEKE